MRIESFKPIEFFHKKAAYIFPAQTKIFQSGEKLSVEIDGKKVSDISKYLADGSGFKRPYQYKIGLPITEEGSRLQKEYQSITDYLEKNPRFDFLQFDHATGNELALCTFFKSTDSIQADKLIREIKKELPYLINIFKRPLIHLKENDIVQPVDAVKRINHNTLIHLSRHAENWENVKNDKIVPARLLTRVYEDDYGIYENVVFRQLIDNLLLFLRKRIYYLSEILNTFKESIQLDAVHRLNHSQYYLAIGKLYVGFSKTENSAEILAMLESTKALYAQIKKYTVREVYAKNSQAKEIDGEIKKTNILTMHKDYRHVYSLYQSSSKRLNGLQGAGAFATQNESQQSYELFCQMLLLFAVSNFNMVCKNRGAVFGGGEINAGFEFKGWSATTEVEYNPILDLNAIVLKVANNGKSRAYLLIPTSYCLGKDKKMQYENIIERLYLSGYNYDKYIFLEPFDFYGNRMYNYSVKHSVAEKDLFYAVLPASISEINSFRRLQKILFEGMVLTESNHEICAFCGEQFVKEADGKILCRKCRTAVADINCAHCGKDFTATYIDVKNKKKAENESYNGFSDGVSEFYKYEKETQFRNITNMKEKNFICPHCGGENAN